MCIAHDYFCICRSHPWPSQTLNPPSEAENDSHSSSAFSQQDVMEGVNIDVGSASTDARFERGMVYKDLGICMVRSLLFDCIHILRYQSIHCIGGEACTTSTVQLQLRATG